jgi:hypothetical protein
MFIVVITEGSWRIVKYREKLIVWK